MRLAALAAAVLVPACAGLWGPAPIHDCPGELAPLEAIPDDLRLRLRMRVRSDQADASLELAVEKRPGELVLVAFDPLGTLAFSVIQRPDAVEVERRLPPALQPVPPLNALRDLHRARFLGASRGELDNGACGYRVELVELAGGAPG